MVGQLDTPNPGVKKFYKTFLVEPEEGEDDVKSSCPLCPGRHTCYNGRDKGSRSREGELTPKTRPQFGLQAATRLHEARDSSIPSVKFGRPRLILKGNERKK
ncbi:hypothetical protein E3N88_03414 [Mikania micrantha]|uniref:Uncharacterized protein n=1 Tax=Mikania micrantha TaxID=192012 RepID=A0A5N6Q8S0_9ASTR|nr:hypothetical protein E3N88_03414 [Mikania micrantha]